jgi:hypothetical protein
VILRQPIDGRPAQFLGKGDQLVGVIVGGATDVVVLNDVALSSAGIELIGI